MAFNGLSFMYDNVNSEEYGIYIGSIDGGNVEKTSASTNIDLIFESINGRDENFIFGTKNTQPTLTFQLNIFKDGQLSRSDIALIDKWLFSKSEPKRLIINQDDMSGYYYMAVFSKNQIVSVGNRPVGFECTVVCDSSYAYEFDKTAIFTLGSNNNFIFNNTSSGIGYLYPSIEFTCTKANGSLRIKNITDNNKEFYMWGLQSGEKIDIDSWFQIKSSTGLLRLGNCNKQWLGFVNGVNKLEITGDVASIKIKYKFKRGIGG